MSKTATGLIGRARSLVLAAAALAVTAGASLPAAAAPVNIRVSWVALPNNLPPLLFKKPELAKHLGKTYTMEAVQYRGTPQSITALATGALDIALLSYSSFPLAITNAGMTDLRIIADSFQDGEKGYYSGQFLVLKNGLIKKVTDLKGKVIAVNVKGGATDAAAQTVLAQHGLHKGDYNVLEVAFPNMRAVLAEKKVDLISVGTPLFSWDPDMQAIATPLFTQADAFGKTDVVIWVARKGFLDKHRAAMVDFMEDMVRDRRRLLDPANHDEAVKLVSAITKIPAAKLTSWLFTKDDYYRSPDAQPDLKALQANIDELYAEKAIPRSVDVSHYTDLSILNEALARLK